VPYCQRKNRNQLWTPAGFTHGFITLSETAEFQYKTTDFYSTKSEHFIAWNDPVIGIEWPMDCTPLLSDKDKKGLALSEADLFD
jgi:dTDP-4-dehydrorhamnose 3,5-epimerase